MIGSFKTGATWTTSAVPVGMVRYGSFPSKVCVASYAAQLYSHIVTIVVFVKDTWYVTSGMWGDDVSSSKGTARMSSKVTVGADGRASIQDAALKVIQSAAYTSFSVTFEYG